MAELRPQRPSDLSSRLVRHRERGAQHLRYLGAGEPVGAVGPIARRIPGCITIVDEDKSVLGWEGGAVVRANPRGRLIERQAAPDSARSVTAGGDQDTDAGIQRRKGRRLSWIGGELAVVDVAESQRPARNSDLIRSSVDRRAEAVRGRVGDRLILVGRRAVRAVVNAVESICQRPYSADHAAAFVEGKPSGVG